VDTVSEIANLGHSAAGASPAHAHEVVYPSRVSDKAPQTYVLHTTVLFIILVTILVIFLRHQWG